VGKDRIRDDGRDERVTVAEAAERLGITKEAVRKRISRGTLLSDKDPDGTVRAYVPASGTASGTASEAFDRDELVELLRAQLEDLRADRDAWRDQVRRSDYLLGTSMERTRELENRLRELEAPAESPAAESVSPETTTAPSEDTPPRSTTVGPEMLATEGPSEAEPSLLWERVAVVVLSILPLPVLLAVFLLDETVALRNPWSWIPYVLGVTVALVWVVFPAVFGFRLGRKRRRLRFWRNVAPVAALIWLVGVIAEVGTTFYLPVIPSIVYIFAAILGNAVRRRQREKLIEERPSEFPQEEVAADARGWTPRHQAIVGLAGTIIASLIGLIGTILTVLDKT
jgi:hypothetical protein